MLSLLTVQSWLAGTVMLLRVIVVMDIGAGYVEYVPMVKIK